jgi:hypothetical protein
LAHWQSAHWQFAHWQLAVPRLAQSQVAHSQVAQPQSDGWVTVEDGMAAWMLVEEDVISVLQRGW